MELILYKSRAQTRLNGQIITAIIYQTKSAWTKHDANESMELKWCWKKLSSIQGENIKILKYQNIRRHGMKIKNPTKERYNQMAQTTRSYNQSVKIINLWFFIVKDYLTMLCTTSIDRYVVLAYELYTYIYETSDNIHYNTIELDMEQSAPLTEISNWKIVKHISLQLEVSCERTDRVLSTNSELIRYLNSWKHKSNEQNRNQIIFQMKNRST